jgi:hypothetical protein
MQDDGKGVKMEKLWKWCGAKLGYDTYRCWTWLWWECSMVIWIRTTN